MKNDLTKIFRGFIKDESAATAIEYALIAAFLSISIVTVVVVIGDKVRDDLFGRVAAVLLG